MSNQIEATIKEVEKFNDSIRDALDSKNISNTREAVRSIYIDFGENFVRSMGIFYLEFLDTGRAPGKFPPKEPIERWVQTKLGLSPGNSEFDGIVFVIQRKIAQLGTEIYLNKGKGIELSEKIVTLRENLNIALRESAILTVKQRLNRFKQAHLKNKYQI